MFPKIFPRFQKSEPFSHNPAHGGDVEEGRVKRRICETCKIPTKARTLPLQGTLPVTPRPRPRLVLAAVQDRLC